MKCSKCEKINFKSKNILVPIKYKKFSIEIYTITKFIPYSVTFVHTVCYKITHPKINESFMMEKKKYVVYNDVLKETLKTIKEECKNNIDLYLKENKNANIDSRKS